jgi:hypothetical protein
MMNSIDNKITNPLVGFYIGFTSLVLINVFIALLSATFTRVYEKAEAEIMFQRAIEIYKIEKSMSFDERKKNIKTLFTHTRLKKEFVRKINEGTNEKDKRVEAVNEIFFKFNNHIILKKKLAGFLGQ